MNIPTRPDVNFVELPEDDISKLGFKFITPLKEDIEIYLLWIFWASYYNPKIFERLH